MRTCACAPVVRRGWAALAASETVEAEAYNLLGSRTAGFALPEEKPGEIAQGIQNSAAHWEPAEKTPVAAEVALVAHEASGRPPNS